MRLQEPTREEAKERVRDPHTGYVRIGGHSATSEEEVDHIFDVRQPAWQDWVDNGSQPPAKPGEQGLKAENAALKAEIEALKAQPAKAQPVLKTEEPAKTEPPK